jgi:hypothetical protein
MFRATRYRREDSVDIPQSDNECHGTHLYVRRHLRARLYHIGVTSDKSMTSKIELECQNGPNAHFGQQRLKRSQLGAPESPTSLSFLVAANSARMEARSSTQSAIAAIVTLKSDSSSSNWLMLSPNN